MHVTLRNIRNLNFDTIDIKGEWNMPTERESRMHSIHAYPAKFPAFITTKAIKKAEEKNIRVDTVGDIFCGCGTVAYETVKCGKHFWGCDINPVATLIADAKSHTYDEKALLNYFQNILKSYETIRVNHNDAIFEIERIHYWFDDEHINDLLRLRTAIRKIVKNEDYKKFFLCAFSNILKSCSRWLTKSIKPQVDPNKKPKNVISAFTVQFELMKKANSDNHIVHPGSADIETVNFLTKDFDVPFVDLIVTSPPYVTSYEYADLHQLSTMWLGFTDDFRTFREGTIGSLHNSHSFGENVKRLNKTGRDIVFQLYATDKPKTRSVAQYYVDMQTTISKVAHIINPGGACLFVIGNTEYKGVKIDNAKHLAECLLTEKFHDVSVERRKISNKILTPYCISRNKASKF